MRKDTELARSPLQSGRMCYRWVEVVCDLQQSTVTFSTMVYTESLLSLPNKGNLIGIALDMRNSKLDTKSILTDIKNELSELWKSYNKLETELAASKLVKEIIKKQIVMLERNRGVMNSIQTQMS